MVDRTRTQLFVALVMAASLLLFVQSASAQSTAFTYQGELLDNGQPAGGEAGTNYTLAFTPYGMETGGAPLTGAPATWTGTVKRGRFTATVDFGAETDALFNGQDVWFEIAVNGQALAQRQKFMAAPVAKKALDAWGTKGNAGTDPNNGDFLGTTDNSPLEVRVRDQRALRIEPARDGNTQMPNIISGCSENYVTTGKYGATIAGGGEPSGNGKNLVTQSFGTVGGGWGNKTGDWYAVVAGGITNSAMGQSSSILGGHHNTTSDEGATIGGGDSSYAFGRFSTVGGGLGNLAVSNNSTIAGGIGNRAGDPAGDPAAIVPAERPDPLVAPCSTVAGGCTNKAVAENATVAGGSENEASGKGAAVGGGKNNKAKGDFSTIPGGENNEVKAKYGFAGGRRGRVNGVSHDGTFVWADSQGADFVSTAANQFLVRAAGGVGINRNNPSGGLDVNGSIYVPGGVITTSQGGSIELGARGTAANPVTGGVPYIDFHYGNGSAQDYNVRIINDANGHLGVYGNMYVNGTLGKAGGSFKIDHPLDPANKYLLHSFVESPDMMNIYNGVIVTDAAGRATVTLPEWFEPLNRDFRYQLTVIDESDGEEFFLAKVIREVRGNEFTIRTSRPQVKVSWQVTGIRQDAWANAHRIPVEEAKVEKDRGRFLHPDLFGAAEALRIGAMAADSVDATSVAGNQN